MIRTGLYRLPTFCGWDVDASQCRTNSRQDSFRYNSITLAWTGHRVLQQYTGCVTEIFPEHHVSDLGPSVPGSYATMPSNSWPRGEVIDGRAPARNGQGPTCAWKKVGVTPTSRTGSCGSGIYQLPVGLASSISDSWPIAKPARYLLGRYFLSTAQATEYCGSTTLAILITALWPRSWYASILSYP